MRKLESYIKVHGKIEGPKLYRQLQREAAFASAAARTKKRIAKRVATQGGEARAASLTKERRRAIARKAAQVRWSKKGG